MHNALSTPKVASALRGLTVHMQTTLDGRISWPDGLVCEPFPYGEEENVHDSHMFAEADNRLQSSKLYEFVEPYGDQVGAGSALHVGVPDSPARDDFAQTLAGLHRYVLSTTLADNPAHRRTLFADDVVKPGPRSRLAARGNRPLWPSHSGPARRRTRPLGSSVDCFQQDLDS